MSKTTTAFGISAFAAFAFGWIVLYLFPVGRLLVLAAGMGLAPLTALMFIEGLVALARAVSPLRSIGWFKPGDAFVPGVVAKVVALELALSALGAALVTAAAPWWQPLTGLAPPLWLIALVALRASGHAIMTTFLLLKRPFGGIAGLLDMILVLPIVALFGGSLESVVIASTAITVLLTALSVRTRPITMVVFRKTETEREQEREKLRLEREEAATADRWHIGSWLNGMVGYLRKPLFVAFGGLAVVVPFSAATIASSLMLLPFMAAALVKPSPSIGMRFFRGIVLATASFLLVHVFGPAIYRLLFPSSFGDGSWVATLAWSGFVMLPLAMRTLPEKTTQLRQGATALISVALLIILGLQRGVEGFLLAIALGTVVSGMFAMTSKSSNEPPIAD